MREKCDRWWSQWPIVTRSLVTVWLGATSRDRIFDEHALGTKRRIISVIKSKAFGDPIFSVCVNIILPSVSLYCEQLVSLNDHLHTCVCQVYLCLLTFFSTCCDSCTKPVSGICCVCTRAYMCMYVCCVCTCMYARARVCVCVFVRARVYRVTLFCIANAAEECVNTIDGQSHAFREITTILCISLPKYPKEEEKEKENSHDSTVIS